MPTQWTKFRAGLDPHVRRFGYYTAYPLEGSEHLTTLDQTHDLKAAVRFLEEHGYEPQYLSAAKRHPATNQLHDASYRRVPNRHPETAQETKLTSLFAPNECQLHVHVFQTDEGISFYSHYEARPDFLRPTPSIHRLRTHYRPIWGETYLQGVTDLNFAEYL